MRIHAGHFDDAEEVRVVGEGTDLRLSLAGRSMRVAAPGSNVPGGEFFGCPVEDSAEGEIAFTEFPAMFAGREIRGIRLRFEGGRRRRERSDQRGVSAADARHRRGCALSG